MAPPTKASLQIENAVLRRRITVALELHTPVKTQWPGNEPLPVITCLICRDPYPCDTAVALGDR